MNQALQITPAAQIVAGLLLLFLGRRLFWLFVAMVGFFLGAQIAVRMFDGLVDWMVFLVAVGSGLVGALLAVLLQRLAVTVAGAIAGGLLAMRIAPLVGLLTPEGMAIAFVAGALLAAVLLAVLFDPALIVISALIGAVMAAEAFPIDPLVEPLVLVVLVSVGIFVQSRSSASRIH